MAAIPERGPHSFGGVNREDYAALVEKGERTRGLWWSRDPVVNTANGAGRLNQGLLLLFLRYGTPDWAEGEGRTVSVCGYSKGL